MPAFFLRKAGRWVRRIEDKASMTQTQLCCSEVVGSGKNGPELFWMSTWLALLNLLVSYVIFNIFNLIRSYFVVNVPNPFFKK